MHIALTGVSGFLGTYIARQLHRAGHTITALVRSGSRRDHVEKFIQRFVIGDQSDQKSWPSLLEGAECVVHNSLDWRTLDAGDIAKHLQTNLLGSIELLRASAPRQFIYISSIAVHHDMRPRWQGVIDEDHPLRPAHWYGALKAAVEAHLWAAHFSEGRNTCAIRPCGVYGIDPVLSRSHGYALVEKLMRGEKKFNKAGGGKFVHVNDVADVVVAAVGNTKVAGRPFNLVDCYARWADWVTMAAELMGLDVEIDMSSPAQSQNVFTKNAVASLGVSMNRGHQGIREHLRELITLMKA